MLTRSIFITKKLEKTKASRGTLKSEGLYSASYELRVVSCELVFTHILRVASWFSITSIHSIKVSYEFFEEISITLLSFQGAFKLLGKISLKQCQSIGAASYLI